MLQARCSNQVWSVSNPGGFTLIELLVAIAIIAILASILMPVFASVRAKARETRDLSNLRQIMLALTMYYDDHGECYPPGETDGLDDLDPIMAQLQPYTRNQQIFTDSYKGSLVYFSRRTYHVLALEYDGQSLSPDSYQGFFKGRNGEFDLEATHGDNADNLWIDVENSRVLRFQTVQMGLK